MLDTLTEQGFTYNSAGSVVAYSYVSDWEYDSLGRVTLYKGPRTDTSYDETAYTYHSSSNLLLDGYRHQTKRRKNLSGYLIASNEDFDFWGNSVSRKSPNGDFRCTTYDDERNVLQERRLAMNGQTSCTSTNAADIIVQMSYDSALRRTKVIRPLGNCMHTEYGSWGRISKLKARDNCNATWPLPSCSWKHAGGYTRPMRVLFIVLLCSCNSTKSDSVQLTAEASKAQDAATTTMGDASSPNS